jgi:DNA-binding FadR family transcriptional regulator
MFQFEQATMLDVLRARQLLEPSLSRLAADFVTHDQLAAMREAVQRVRDAPEDHKLYIEQNERFHNLIGEASGSPVLRLYSGSLQSIADGGMVGFRYAPKQRLATADFHEKILDSLGEGDRERAEQIMYEHLVDAGEYWQRRYPGELRSPLRWRE